MAVNAHRSFNGSHEHAYLHQLKVPDETIDEMREARDSIRQTLRAAFHDWSRNLNQEGNDSDLVVNSPIDQESLVGTPKFRMQGSQSYYTANDPAHKPPQQIDLDDGMFLPVSFLEQGGKTHPVLVSAAYFKVVERALEPLCKANDWKLVTDRASCVRVELNNECHVDIALYAVPDQEFQTLIEKSEHARIEMSADNALDRLEILDEAYARLRSDQMMLAHRKNGWMPSDPRELEDWFKGAVEDFGYQVRYVSRYLKGWRDEEWESSRLSSIALMSAAVTVFGENGAHAFDGRDDLALLAVAKRLPDILGDRIPNPRVDGVYLDDGWSSEERAQFVEGARGLAGALTDALENSTSANFTIECLQSRLGDRLPNDRSLVIVEKSNASEAPSAPAVVGLFKDEDADARPAVRTGGDERYG